MNNYERRKAKIISDFILWMKLSKEIELTRWRPVKGSVPPEGEFLPTNIPLETLIAEYLEKGAGKP